MSRYLRPEIGRLLREETRMAFIAGPRQVGKTTLAQSLLPEAGQGYFNWDVEEDQRAILQSPSDFWRRSPAGENGKPRVVLDEIHKYPRWKRFLKGYIDKNRGAVETMVTGSGRLDVYQRGGDSLFGRYNLYRLHPFTVGEFLSAGRATVAAPDSLWEALQGKPLPAGADAALQHVERFTGFPEPLFAGSDLRLRRWRRDHRRLVLREDLRDLTQIRDIGLVDSLLFLLPERIGAPLSVNALAEDLRVTFATVSNWLSALARLYFIFEIRPYAGRLARTLRREAKVYLFDPTEITSPGAQFENMVALHLVKCVDAWNDWGYGDFEMHYVRDKEKREVDFLITQARKPHLMVECKRSDTTLSPALTYFRDRLNPQGTIQVVRDVKPDFLVSHGHNTFTISAARLLSNL